jgi:hypothetical protein
MANTIKISEMTIPSIFGGIFAADVRADGAKRKLFAELAARQVTLADLADGGRHRADLIEGVLTAWQGETFAAAFAVSSGDVPLDGVIVMADGTKASVTKTRKVWQQALGSKVAKVVNGYAAYRKASLDPAAFKAELEKVPAAKGRKARPTDGASQGKPDADEVVGDESKASATRRITTALTTALNIVAKDHDDEEPDFGDMHDEIRAALIRVFELVNPNAAKAYVAPVGQ